MPPSNGWRGSRGDEFGGGANPTSLIAARAVVPASRIASVLPSSIADESVTLAARDSAARPGVARAPAVAKSWCQRWCQVLRCSSALAVAQIA